MFLINLPLVFYVLNPMKDALSIKSPGYCFLLNMTVGMFIILVISALSYKYVERPFLVRTSKGPAIVCDGPDGYGAEKQRV
jgi:peptidoglycan/LPS O-acetylase OafA/YrhL